MKKIIRIILAFTFFANTTFAKEGASISTRDSGVDVSRHLRLRLAHVLKTSPTVGAAFKNLRAGLDEGSARFLEKKISGYENVSVEIKLRNEKEFLIENKLGSAVFSFDDKSSPDEMHLKINNKSIVYRPSQGIEKLWKNIYSALDDKKNSLWSYFIPTAHAFPPLELIAGLILLCGTVVYARGKNACDKVLTEVTNCEKHGYNDKKSFADAVKLSINAHKRILECPKKTEFKSCLDGVLKAQPYFSEALESDEKEHMGKGADLTGTLQKTFAR